MIQTNVNLLKMCYIYLDQQNLTQNYLKRQYDDYLGYIVKPCNASGK